MRIRECLTRDEFHEFHSTMLLDDVLRFDPAAQFLVGTEGTPMRLDLPLPPEALTRLRFQGKKGERALKHNENGQLLHGSAGIDMICRLTPRSAQLFDSLIDGDYQPPCVSGNDC